MGTPIREEYKVDALENGGIYGREDMIESVLKQVRICLHRLQGNPHPFLSCTIGEVFGRQCFGQSVGIQCGQCPPENEGGSLLSEHFTRV